MDPLVVASLALQMRAAQRVDWKLYALTIEVAMIVQRDSPLTCTKTLWRDRLSRVPRARRNGPCTAAADSVQ
jgi:hypothetical protein